MLAVWKIGAIIGRMTERNITHNNLRFVAEYLLEMPRNATAAYKRVYGSHLSDASAAVGANKLLNDPRIKAEVAKREEMLRVDLELEARDVLRDLALLATADTRELTEHWIGACRYCHGEGHKYQRRQSEFDDAFASYLTTDAGKLDPLGINFPILGGVGFSTRRAPHPECPECDGLGEGYEIIKDTRTLSPAAARLYQGVKRTRNGIEVQTRSQDKALELAGQHLGLFRNKVELTGKDGGPVRSVAVGATLKDVDQQTAALIYEDMMKGA